MKINIYFLLRGSNKQIVVSNKYNPVEADNIPDALKLLASNFPKYYYCFEIVGVRLERAE